MMATLSETILDALQAGLLDDAVDGLDGDDQSVLNYARRHGTLDDVYPALFSALVGAYRNLPRQGTQ